MHFQISTLFLIVVFIAGCDESAFKRLDLTKGSFDSSVLAEVERESGITLPQGACGIRYTYIPPIDPIYFAQVELPPESQAAMALQIRQLPTTTEFPDDFADDECDWWPPKAESVLERKKAKSNAQYIDARLIESNGKLYLYLKIFVV